MQKLPSKKVFVSCIPIVLCCVMSGPVFISFWWLWKGISSGNFCEFLHPYIVLYPEKKKEENFTSTDMCGEHALSVVIIANMNNSL